jgi:hypothetical protein
VPEPKIASFLQAFGREVSARMQRESLFEPLAVPALVRTPLDTALTWDSCQTIFPFMLRHPVSGSLLGMAQVTRVWQLLQSELDAQSLGVSLNVAETRYQLGQAICCGERAGSELGALRLCASAPAVVDALQRGEAAVIGQALSALDKTSAIVRRLRFE